MGNVPVGLTAKYKGKEVPYYNILEHKDNILLFQCRIYFYFIICTSKAVPSWVAKHQVKIPLLAFMSEITRMVVQGQLV